MEFKGSLINALSSEDVLPNAPLCLTDLKFTGTMESHTESQSHNWEDETQEPIDPTSKSLWFGFVGSRSGLWATLGMQSHLENYVILWNAWDQTLFSVTRVQAKF